MIFSLTKAMLLSNNEILIKEIEDGKINGEMIQTPEFLFLLIQPGREALFQHCLDKQYLTEEVMNIVTSPDFIARCLSKKFDIAADAYEHLCSVTYWFFLEMRDHESILELLKDEECKRKFIEAIDLNASPAEGANAGKTLLYLLASSESGGVILRELLQYEEFKQKLFEADFNAGPAEGPDAGVTVLYCLVAYAAMRPILSELIKGQEFKQKFLKANLNAGPVEGPYAGTTLLYWLVGYDLGKTILVELIKDEAFRNKFLEVDLNAGPKEGVDAGTSLLYWLVGSSLGKTILAELIKDAAFREKFLEADLNAGPKEGRHAGESVLYWLARSSLGRTILAKLIKDAVFRKKLLEADLDAGSREGRHAGRSVMNCLVGDELGRTILKEILNEPITVPMLPNLTKIYCALLTVKNSNNQVISAEEAEQAFYWWRLAIVIMKDNDDESLVNMLHLLNELPCSTVTFEYHKAAANNQLVEFLTLDEPVENKINKVMLVVKDDFFNMKEKIDLMMNVSEHLLDTLKTCKAEEKERVLEFIYLVASKFELEGEFDKAANYYKLIPPDHKNYIEAQESCFNMLYCLHATDEQREVYGWIAAQEHRVNADPTYLQQAAPLDNFGLEAPNSCLWKLRRKAFVEGAMQNILNQNDPLLIEQLVKELEAALKKLDVDDELITSLSRQLELVVDGENIPSTLKALQNFSDVILEKNTPEQYAELLLVTYITSKKVCLKARDELRKLAESNPGSLYIQYANCVIGNREPEFNMQNLFFVVESPLLSDQYKSNFLEKNIDSVAEIILTASYEQKRIVTQFLFDKSILNQLTQDILAKDEMDLYATIAGFQSCCHVQHELGRNIRVMYSAMIQVSDKARDTLKSYGYNELEFNNSALKFQDGRYVSGVERLLYDLYITLEKQDNLFKPHNFYTLQVDNDYRQFKTIIAKFKQNASSCTLSMFFNAASPIDGLKELPFDEVRIWVAQEESLTNEVKGDILANLQNPQATMALHK